MSAKVGLERNKQQIKIDVIAQPRMVILFYTD